MSIVYPRARPFTAICCQPLTSLQNHPKSPARDMHSEQLIRESTMVSKIWLTPLHETNGEAPDSRLMSTRSMVHHREARTLEHLLCNYKNKRSILKLIPKLSEPSLRVIKSLKKVINSDEIHRIKIAGIAELYLRWH